MIRVVFSSVCKRMQIQFIGMKMDSSKTLSYIWLYWIKSAAWDVN